MRIGGRSSASSSLEVDGVVDNPWPEDDDPELVRRIFEEIDAGEAEMEAERTGRDRRPHNVGRTGTGASANPPQSTSVYFICALFRIISFIKTDRLTLGRVFFPGVLQAFLQLIRQVGIATRSPES